ncbi:hypothetical protein ACPPVT_19005 [Angustibacter sp. McL0619]|uniref:hypothetical protein n=1 Tax=Angustibacter sp. McL0619 TaxID=3415676 RepID=UPI003CF06C2D
MSGNVLGMARVTWVRLLLLVTIGIGVVRVLVCHYARMSFVQAYADYKHLDTGTFLGLEIAKREVPGHFDSAVFSLLCALLLLIPLVLRVGSGTPWARNLALVLSAAGGLNTLGSLAVPSPWWYYALTIAMVALTGIVIVLLWRTPVIEDAVLRHDLEAGASGPGTG